MAASGPERDPELAKKLFDRAIKIMITTNDITAAVKLFKAATIIDAQHANSWYQLGLHYLNIEKKDQAFECFEKAVSLSKQQGIMPHDWNKFKYLGLCYKDGIGTLMDQEKAVACFMVALEYAHKMAPDYVQIGARIGENGGAEFLMQYADDVVELESNLGLTSNDKQPEGKPTKRQRKG